MAKEEKKPVKIKPAPKKKPTKAEQFEAMGKKYQDFMKERQRVLDKVTGLDKLKEEQQRIVKERKKEAERLRKKEEEEAERLRKEKEEKKRGKS